MLPESRRFAVASPCCSSWAPPRCLPPATRALCCSSFSSTVGSRSLGHMMTARPLSPPACAPRCPRSASGVPQDHDYPGVMDCLSSDSGLGKVFATRLTCRRWHLLPLEPQAQTVTQVSVRQHVYGHGASLHRASCPRWLQWLCGSNPQPGGNLGMTYLPAVMHYLVGVTSQADCVTWRCVI